MKPFRALTLGLAVLSMACTQAEWSSINRQFNPTDGDSRLIDAKQRAIIAVKRPVFIDNKGTVKLTGKWKDKPLSTTVVCAEPSPDALQATAAALSGSGDSEKIASTLAIAFSTAESATSIGLRTQSIQLLRDAYFRLCEAYLNDGIDAVSYDVLQRRFQNQVIALLAVEQLTGATRAAQNSVTTQSSSDAGANAGKLANQLGEARKDLNALKTEGGALTKDIATLEKPVEPENDTDAAKKAAEKAEAERKEKLAAKRTKQAENTTAQEDQVKLIASLDEAYREALKQTTKASASGSATPGTASTGGVTMSKDVTNAVRAITINAINQDYETQVCFETLRTRNHNDKSKNKLPFGDEFFKYCGRLLNQTVALKQAQAKALDNRTDHLGKIVDAATCGGKCKAKLTPKGAADLILAYDRATPLRPETRFLAETLEISEEKTSGATPEKAGGSPAPANKGTTKTTVKTHSISPAPDAEAIKKLRQDILGEIQKLGVSAPASGGATSEQEVVTRLKSVTTTTVAGQEVRPVCPANASYDGAVGACVCNEGFTDTEGTCVKPPQAPVRQAD